MGGDMSRAAFMSLAFAAIAVSLAGAQPSPSSAELPPGEVPKVAQTEGKKEDERPESDLLPKNPLVERLNLKPTFELRGRIEAEAVMAAQSVQSRGLLGDLQDGYGFRRVRLGAQGTIGDSASWVSEVELAGGDVRLRDVFVGLDAIPWVRQIRVGNFREPYSLEGMTSSNFITFLERSPVNVLSPARNWGVCGYWWPDDERVLFSLGLFRDGLEHNGESLGDGSNWAWTTRLTGLPVYQPDADVFQLVHVGGAFSQRVPPDGVINFSPHATSSLLTVDDNPSSPFLATVNIPTNNYQLYNLQAAWVRGPLSVQGEWSAAMVQQTNAGSVFAHGIYVYGSYFVTGEHREYDRTRGSFGQVDVLRPVIRSKTDPRRGCGALELTLRFSHLDFNSPNLPPDANGFPSGALLYEMTAGANWYLNSYTRVMFNYTAGMPDKVAFGPTVAHTFGIRTAIYW
jgi:phosphate-selective porin OprO/OprP